MLRSHRRLAALTSLIVLAVSVTAGVSVAAEPKVGSSPATIVKYRDSGEWTRTITKQYDRARKYVKAWLKENPKPRKRKPAVVLDIDDTALSWYFCAKELDPPFGGGLPGCAVSSLLRAIPQARSFYNYVRARGVTVFFITGRPESLRPQTVESLKDARYTGKLRVYLKPPSYKRDSVIPYKAGARKKITGRGYRILVNVGDQQSDLKGGYSKKTYKLPNPMYFTP